MVFSLQLRLHSALLEDGLYLPRVGSDVALQELLQGEVALLEVEGVLFRKDLVDFGPVGFRKRFGEAVQDGQVNVILLYGLLEED